MPRRQPFARFGITAEKASIRPGIHDSHTRRSDQLFQSVGIHDQIGAHPRREVALAHHRRQVFQLSAGRDPGMQPAIEHAHVGMSHHSQHPPDAGRREKPVLVIYDDPVAIPHAQLADTGRELDGVRQHVRQVRGRICDLVDIEMHGAGNVAARPCLATGFRRIGEIGKIGRIQDADIRRDDIVDQPVCTDERVTRFHLVMSPSTAAPADPSISGIPDCTVSIGNDCHNRTVSSRLCGPAPCRVPSWRRQPH